MLLAAVTSMALRKYARSASSWKIPKKSRFVVPEAEIADVHSVFDRPTQPGSENHAAPGESWPQNLNAVEFAVGSDRANDRCASGAMPERIRVRRLVEHESVWPFGYCDIATYRARDRRMVGLDAAINDGHLYPAPLLPPHAQSGVRSSIDGIGSTFDKASTAKAADQAGLARSVIEASRGRLQRGPAPQVIGKTSEQHSTCLPLALAMNGDLVHEPSQLERIPKGGVPSTSPARVRSRSPSNDPITSPTSAAKVLVCARLLQRNCRQAREQTERFYIGCVERRRPLLCQAARSHR